MWRFVSVGRKSQLQAEFLATPRWSEKFVMFTQAAWPSYARSRGREWGSCASA